MRRLNSDPYVVARCCDAVRNGDSFAVAARRENVATSTVQDWCRRRGIRSAHPAGSAVGTRTMPRPPRDATPRAPKPRSPFDTTRTALESTWGPYATWTRDQHARHSEILRRLAGIADATPQTEDRAA